MSGDESFLTETQERVLELREEGLSQTEIAEKLGTSCSNICSIEKRARRNIERARNTLNEVRIIQAPLTMKVAPGDDILDSIKSLFSKADEADLHVSLDTPELISKIEQESRDKLRGRKVVERIEISLTSDGDVIIS